MKVFSSYKDVDEAVLTIKKLVETSGKLPEVLISSYSLSLAKATQGVVQRFYAKLAQECPEALVHFVDV